MKLRVTGKARLRRTFSEVAVKHRRQDQLTAAPEVDVLRQASDGLLYPSESDEPFTPFAWPAGADASRDSALAQVTAHSNKGAAVTEQSADDFFSALNGTPDASRYQQLRKTLEEQLVGLKVFRVGEARVAVYLVGKGRSGAWAGLQTTSVET